MQQRITAEVNAGSMADIAFLLLIFFLVSTTIDVDKGLTVKLPILPEGPVPTSEINQRNVLNILINSKDDVMVNNELTELAALQKLAKTFITNPLNEEDKAFSPQKATISLKNDESTTYQTYLMVHNEIKAVYNQLWNEAAQKQFGENYEQLNNIQRVKIKELFPYRISEAEPNIEL